MPHETLDGIGWALEKYAEVISIRNLHVRDFPGIKNGKQRVVLRPREGGLPPFFRWKSVPLLHFTPYCKDTDQLQHNYLARCNHWPYRPLPPEQEQKQDKTHEERDSTWNSNERAAKRNPYASCHGWLWKSLSEQTQWHLVRGPRERHCYNGQGRHAKWADGNNNRD